MRTLILVVMCLLTACANSSGQTDAIKQAQAFYDSYLMALAGDDSVYPDSKLREYVSSDTLARIAMIQSMPDQDLLTSDYFTYTQDYDPAWIQALRVDNARLFMGGWVVQVRLGIEEGKTLRLEAFMRHESGVWKIYRVRDLTDRYEHPVFNSGAIVSAKDGRDS
ncbi:YbjP/YqhG family protein [Siccibacter turicensis]|uniref:YbjP/YqhG family protein n=1 Tax=Siccibacter turicensis TaxID=357233 RepID=UPI003F54F356